MRDAWGNDKAAGIAWKDVHAYAKDFEREFGLEIVWHLWPDISSGKVWRMALRAEAVLRGAGYRSKPVLHFYELWPNGRQTTLCGAYYRAILELWSLAEQRRERGARP